MKLRVVNVVGARPNFMKIAPLMPEYRKHPADFEPVLVHTGQHYDDNMSQQFFEQLHLPEPDVYLGVGSGTHSEQTAKVMVELEKFLTKTPADLVVVVGDVNSTMAAAIVAAKLCVPVAHIEAGLRSFDRTMPEEINRLVTDALADYCFTTSPDADENLRHEGVSRGKIFFVGNVMIDTLLQLKEAGLKSDVRRRLRLDGEFGFVTLHRPSNVDSKETLAEILSALDVVQKKLPLVFPAHPRTVNRLKQFGYWDELQRWENLRLVEPIGYLDSLCLMANAKLVLTDSGGMQEETTVLGTPCLTIRENTERPITITEGTNTLVGTSHAKIVAEARHILEGRGKTGRVPKFWDGRAAERIVQCLLEHRPKK
ncbi:MAG TPA: UDP-N-acetylglucosamine 2-epimerase (non-hydrolyzing) [Verrucomicrobiae bacterium]|nr:UDP-N-acetylglucosamine 2-epimerase (non-hydrolyzing) [Verrucomicrobiae bacterium]